MASQSHTIHHYPIVSPTLPDPADLMQSFRDVFASGKVTVGPNVAELERAVRDYTGVSYAVAVSNATSGLMLLMRALELPRGSEVIVPSFTFAATAHALLWNGLTPVFCDSEPDSFTMDPEAAGSLITKRTSALYPVCIFGVPGDLDAYERIAREHGLALLFDSAQGLGSIYKSRPLGGFGRGEVFSLSPTKVVTALEGGLVTTNDSQLADRVRCMRDYGKSRDGEDMDRLGLSARMTEVNAIVAGWSLDRVEHSIACRAAALERYRRNLSGIPGVRFQKIPDYCRSSINYIVILLDPDRSPVTRDELHYRLKDESVQTKRYFYPALHNQSLYRDLEPMCARRLPVAEEISSRGLALPLYSHMTLAEVDEVCDRIHRCIRRADAAQSAAAADTTTNAIQWRRSIRSP